ncbi:hypothetical protein [Nonomuraea ceibae]|uniref:hypothetical protein n=1 Tax=Nonomuraea ceibae TaxID=1935170 RepID=UPI001C5EA094|nr:hypothetical protein [Nonomuraea ceibae]
MKSFRPTRHLIILSAIILAAVTGSVGLAIANPNRSAGNEAACAVWETPGTPAYQQCLDNLNASDHISLIPGEMPAPSTTATMSSASEQTGSHPPTYFCLDSGKSHHATINPLKNCNKQLVCLWQAPDGKYHCVDNTGKPVDPPGGICRPGRNPHYACADEPAVMVVSPDKRLPTAPDTPTAALPDQPADSDPAHQPGPTSHSTPPSASPTTSAPTQAHDPADPADPVTQALAQARAHGLRIWLETDLVNAWKQGPEHLKASAEQLSQFADRPGVVGVKLAYDLGLRGFTDEDQISQFVTETSRTLRATLPAGRKIAVDVVIPELGCGSNQRCAQAMRQAYPLLTLARVESYVLSGAVDAVNITGGLFADKYAEFKITTKAAAANLWQRLRLLSWKTRVPGLYIGSREIGLAHTGATSAITATSANRLIQDRIDAPLRTGADHIVLWTLRQTFNGQTWRLTDAGLQRNPIWNALRTRNATRALSITYNPREPESNVGDDIKVIADIASAIFIYVP